MDKLPPDYAAKRCTSNNSCYYCDVLNDYDGCPTNRRARALRERDAMRCDRCKRPAPLLRVIGTFRCGHEQTVLQLCGECCNELAHE